MLAIFVNVSDYLAIVRTPAVEFRFRVTVLVEEDYGKKPQVSRPVMLTDNRVMLTDNRVMLTDNRVMLTDNRVMLIDNRVMLIDNRVMLTDNRVMLTDNRVMLTDNRVMLIDNRVMLIDNRETKNNGRPRSKGFVCLLVGCLTSQQHASVSQGRVCSDNCTCCHTEIQVADQAFHLTQSQYTDTGPTSPSADPITSGAWQGSHWSTNV